MRRTSIALLAVLALLSAAAGFGFDHVLTASGRATFVPSVFLPALLLMLAIVVVALAWPVRRSVRGGTRIDPFRALRAATLARASSLLGAILLGFAAGLLAFLATRPVPAQVGSTVAMAALIVGALVLIGAAMVAEQFCTLPKDSDDREPDEPAP